MEILIVGFKKGEKEEWQCLKDKTFLNKNLPINYNNIKYIVIYTHGI